MTIEECLRSAKIVMEFLTELGFKVNLKKSRLTPASKFEWLGLNWDLTQHSLSLPPRKRKTIAKLTRTFLKSRKMSRRALERVLGSLQFAAVTDHVLRAKLKDVNRVWLSRANKRLRDRKVLLPAVLRRRLAPWSTARSLSRSVPLHFPPLR